MKRLGIYLAYDKQKIIDTYIGYMLRELKTCVHHLVVVCNMTEIFRGKAILEKYADEIFCRENIGYDAGGFKEALGNFIGWDVVWKYDELVLVNDSIFGPFIPMKKIFSKMDKKSADFWGLAAHGTHDKDFLKHIQTYFLVVRSKMLHSIQFRDYWEEMPLYTDFLDVVYEHEVKFTSFFERLGYTYDVLADTNVNDSEINSKNNYIQYAMIPYELIKKRNFPFLKKQPLAFNTLMQQTQENLYQAIDYIDKKTEYDVDLIWENIIRTLNMTDLQRNFHLQYINSSEVKRLNLEKKVAVIVFAEHKEAKEYVLEYLKELEQKKEFSIYVISEKNEIIESYKDYTVKSIELLFMNNCNWAELSQYDYVCALHDADMTSDVKPSCTGKSYFYCIWENLFRDENYVSGIIEKFEKEKRLGFLAPPQSVFADYFGNLGAGWNGKYKVIAEIVKRLQLCCPMSEEKPPFRITDNFWVRGNILKCLENLRKDEYTYLPYLWSYFAQHMGYYSGIVESTDYASMYEVNMMYYLDQLIGQVKKQYRDFNNFDELKEIILIGALNVFCTKHLRVLIYGAGFYAKKYIKFLMNVEACIISDGQDKIDYFEGVPVMYLSEVKAWDECGIVLCLNRENQKMVIPLLERVGVKEYFCIT